MVKKMNILFLKRIGIKVLYMLEILKVCHGGTATNFITGIRNHRSWNSNRLGLNSI